MTSAKRLRAAFGVEKTDFRGVLGLGEAVLGGMTHDTTTFSDPRPTMVVFGPQVTTYKNALDATTRKVAGSVPPRNAALETLWGALGSLRTYTQTLADESPENAETIIKAAGFAIAGTGAHAKPPLAAKNGVSPGDVLLTANATLLKSTAPTTRRSGNTAFRWRHAVTGGTGWIEDTATTAAHTALHGLPSGQTVNFQVCIVLSNVSGPWSESVSLMIH